MAFGDFISGAEQLVGDSQLVGDALVSGAEPYWTQYGGDEYAGDYASSHARPAMHYAGDGMISGDRGIYSLYGDDAAAMMSMGDVGRAPRGRGRPTHPALLNQLAAQAQHAQQFRHAAHNLAMQRGQPMVVRQIEPDRKLKLPAGFAALAVAAAASAPITVRPQCLFRADELVIPELFGANFVITELSIGQTRLIVGGAPVSALGFSEKSLRPLKLDWPTNQITQEILMVVTNITAAAHDLYGMFYGRAAF